VAMKKLSTANEQQTTQVVTEAQFLSSLQHPNIVRFVSNYRIPFLFDGFDNFDRFLGIYRTDGTMYIVMEYMNMGSLLTVVRYVGSFLSFFNLCFIFVFLCILSRNMDSPLPAKQMLDIMLQLSTGMLYLQKNNVLHCESLSLSLSLSIYSFCSYV
jgi:serine/threonine protein kinase